MTNARDYWKQTKQKILIEIFPDKDDRDRKCDYLGTWAEFKNYIENKLQALSEEDRLSVRVDFENDYDTGISFSIRGIHVETDEEQAQRVKESRRERKK